MILQINSVSKSFGTDEILNDVSIKLEERERVGVIGKNGCGKSTLLKIICGEMPYDSGNISIAHGAKIGYLKQVASFVSENTIIEEMMSVFSDVSFYISVGITVMCSLLAFKKVHPILIICLSAAIGIAAGYGLKLPV